MPPTKRNAKTATNSTPANQRDSTSVARDNGRENSTSAAPFSSMRGTKKAVAAMQKNTPIVPAKPCTTNSCTDFTNAICRSAGRGALGPSIPMRSE